MMNQYSRSQLLYGREAMDYFASCRIAVFGIGGVGGYVVEALARSGIGVMDLIDDDRICLTNINRQILATRKTVGKYKVDVAEERVHEINPDCKVRVYKTFYFPDTQDQFDFHEYDYIVDAIDAVTGNHDFLLTQREWSLSLNVSGYQTDSGSEGSINLIPDGTDYACSGAGSHNSSDQKSDGTAK